MNNDENNMTNTVPEIVQNNNPVQEPVQMNTPVQEPIQNDMNNSVPETNQTSSSSEDILAAAPTPSTTESQTPNINIQPMNTFEAGTIPNTSSTTNKPKKKGPLIIIIVLLIVCGLGVGAYFGFRNVSRTNIGRTLMIYMVGADLESENAIGTADLEGLDYKKLKENDINVIVMAGGSKQWYNNYIDKSSTSIYELTESGYKQVKNYSKKNMGDGNTLSDFLSYGYNNYKSGKYDLILWNHGGGILGAEQDELFRDTISLKEFSDALNKSPFNKNNKLELVIFRTCLNGMLEVASTFKDYADYMVGSEETTSGYYEASLFSYLNDISNHDDAVSLGKKFIDGYMSYNKEVNKLTNTPQSSDYVTYALFDLSKLGDLESSVNSFFSGIDLSKDYNKVASVRSKLKQYGYDSSESGLIDSVDLYNLVDGIKDLSKDGNKVLSNLKSVVLYSKSPDSKSNGLSIYFPYNGKKNERDAILNTYYTVDSLKEYKDFITKFNTMQSGGKRTSFSSNTTSLTPSSDSNYDFEFTLTDEQLETYATAEYMVIRDNKDGTFKQVYNSTNVELDGNKIKAKVKGKQLDVVSKDNNESYIINVYEKNNTDDYIEYVTYPVLQYMPVEDIDSLQNWKIQKAKMSLLLDKKTNEITVGKVSVQPKNYNSTEDDSSSVIPETFNVQVNINDYDTVVFGSTSFNMFDENGRYTSDWDNDGKFIGYEVKPENLSFKLNDFSSGEEYYAVFAIYDTYNNVYYSDKVKMN